MLIGVNFRELHKKDELLAAALRYPILWDGHTSTGSVQVLPVLDD